MKQNTKISILDNLGIRRNATIEVGANGSYESGVLMDANAVEKMVDNKIANVVGGATTSADTLKELEDKVNALKMSQVTNDAGYVQQDANGNLKVNETNITNTINKIVVANQPFPEGWPKNEPTETGYPNIEFADLITAMDADTEITAGKVYLATVHYSDLYDAVTLNDAELKIEVMKWEQNAKIAVFSITSANKAPYNWHNTLWNGSLGTWHSYALVDDSASEPVGE